MPEIDIPIGTWQCTECHLVYADVVADDSLGRCPECHMECADCGATCEAGDVDTFGHCDECEIVCSNCGDHFQYRNSLNRDFWCVACLDAAETDNNEEEENDTSENLHEHCYKPNPVFIRAPIEAPKNTDKREKMFLGLEIETEMRRGQHRDAVISTAPGRWYAKEDGSLRRGIEFVSHPRTMLAWRAADLSWLESAAKRGKIWSYNTTTCGLHVHISKNIFTRLTLFKLLKFFACHQRYIRLIARREQNTYCRGAYAPYQWKERAHTATWNDDAEFSRYEEINCSNAHTIEFRIFKGTTKASSILTILGWCAAMVTWARVVSMRRLTVEAFQAWLRGVAAKQLLGADLALKVLEFPKLSHSEDK